MRLSSRRPSPALVLGVIALFVALTGTSIAAVSQLVPRNSVGTAQLRNNAVTSAKIRNNTIAVADLSRAARRPGPVGPVGPAGPQGPAGPAGPAGAVTRLTAVVNATGSLARSQGTTSAGRIGTGQYEVIFNQDVTNCTYAATIGNPTAVFPATGEIVVAPRAGNANGVAVATRDSAGTGSDRPFHLVVVC